jgi:Spy/CpxP family protein refolding chaperone
MGANLMNWRTFSAVTAAILILPLGTYAAQAQDNNSGENTTMERSHRNKHGDKRGMRGGIDKLVQQLDLTSEQSAQIEAIQEQSETENQALFEQLQNNRQEMQSLLASDADPEQLRATHQNGQNLRQKLDTNRFETMLEIREVLTPEQRTQMAQMQEQRRGRRFFN